MSVLAVEFEKRRRRLFGLAYRMLGSAADAEDIVQETFLRAREISADELRSPEAFFVTVATRLCLDELKSAKKKRETYVGPWLPEPIEDVEGLSPETAMEYADDLSFALLMTLEKLSPPERAAFLLHDVFDAPFPDIAKALGKSEAACRQLASRARRTVREGKPAREVPRASHAALLQKFAEAIASGDAKNLAALLAADAIAWSDGGGVKRSALNPIIGADKIARFFTGLAAKAARRGPMPSFQIKDINGAPAFLVFAGEDLDQTLSIETDGAQITAVYLVRNPEKLRRLKSAAAGA
jgi:RNA polymerase sigma-70 factor (ECF subfamily)